MAGISFLLLLLAASILLCLPGSDAAFASFIGVRQRPLLSSSNTALQATTNNNRPTSEQVIAAAEQFMANGGYFDPLDENLLADDFCFRGPVIGPLNKHDYIEVLEYFGIYKALPDINPNCFGYSIDPENPLRTWFFVRATGTYQNPIGGPVGSLIAPKGQNYRGSPEAWSLTFNKDLQVRLITAGYVADRFDETSTTDGAGLSFGILKSLGLSLPAGVGDARLRLIQGFASLLQGTNLLPKPVSEESKIPSWWKSSKSGADP